MSLGLNIKFLVDHTGSTYAAIAAHCNTDPQAIHGLVARDSKKSQYAPKIAEFFKMPLELLISGNQEKIASFLAPHHIYPPNLEGQPPAVTAHEPTALGYRIGVPVLKVLDTDSGSSIYMHEAGNFSGSILWSTKDKEAYALRIAGDSLAPRYKHGEFIIIEPSSNAQPGDEVIVLQSGSPNPIVALFSYTRDGMHYFEDINGNNKRTNIPTDNIVYAHVISGSAKSSLWKPLI